MTATQAQLMELAKKSEHFAKASLLRELLELLHFNHQRFVSGAEIAYELWGVSQDQYDDQKVRERIHKLRGKLTEFKERCAGPHYLDVVTSEGDGYQLVAARDEPPSATAIFWRPHTRVSDVSIIYVEPVFFFDAEKERYLRYLDTNPDANPGDEAAGLAELKAKHGKEIRKLYRSGADKKLIMRNVYIGIGEATAIERLSRWFLEKSFLKIRYEASSRATGIQKGCPILLGSHRTNRFTAVVLASDEARHFAYRPHEQLGYFSIKGATKNEKTALGRRFTVNSRGRDEIIVGSGPTLKNARYRLAAVHRLPTPGGRGTITMVSCDTSLAIQQVAATLTDDQQTEAMLARANWKKDALPKSFEMLFGIQVAPLNIPHEVGEADLLVCRSY